MDDSGTMSVCMALTIGVSNARIGAVVSLALRLPPSRAIRSFLVAAASVAPFGAVPARSIEGATIAFALSRILCDWKAWLI
jgi:hypothetical protein